MIGQSRSSHRDPLASELQRGLDDVYTEFLTSYNVHARHSDAAMWEALEAVQMKDHVTMLPGGLDARVTEGGGNLSVSVIYLEDFDISICRSWLAETFSRIVVNEFAVGFALTGVLTAHRVLSMPSINCELCSRDDRGICWYCIQVYVDIALHESGTGCDLPLPLMDSIIFTTLSTAKMVRAIWG